MINESDPLRFERLQHLWQRLSDYAREYLRRGLIERATYWLAHAAKLHRMILGALARGDL